MQDKIISKARNGEPFCNPVYETSNDTKIMQQKPSGGLQEACRKESVVVIYTAWTKVSNCRYSSFGDSRL